MIVLALLLRIPDVSAAAPNVILATTSTQDSGLLDVLIPLFEQKTGYTVKTIAVGTGQSLAMGDRGRGRRRPGATAGLDDARQGSDS